MDDKRIESQISLYSISCPFITAKAKDICSNRGVQFDPFTILVVIQIIILIVKFIWECQHDKTVIFHRLKSPGLFGKRLVKRLIKEQKIDSESRYNLELLFYSYGKSLSQEDFEQILKEVKKQFDINE